MTKPLIVFTAVALFIGMLGCCALGERVNGRLGAATSDPARATLGPIEGAIFALFGLLLAFSFSGAASRFDDRRQLLVEEANALSTAYARLDLLPPDAQPVARGLMRRYVDVRLEAYASVAAGDLDVSAVIAESSRLQGELWSSAVTACQVRAGPETILVLPALNSAFDIANTRLAVTRFHPPLAIPALLFGLALLAAFLAGWGLAATEGVTVVHRVAFALAVTLIVVVTMDLEFPRLGFIRVEAADELLREARARMP